MATLKAYVFECFGCFEKQLPGPCPGMLQSSCQKRCSLRKAVLFPCTYRQSYDNVLPRGCPNEAHIWKTRHTTGSHWVSFMIGLTSQPRCLEPRSQRNHSGVCSMRWIILFNLELPHERSISLCYYGLPFPTIDPIFTQLVKLCYEKTQIFQKLQKKHAPLTHKFAQNRGSQRACPGASASPGNLLEI